MNFDKYVVYDGLHPIALETRAYIAKGNRIPFLDSTNDVMKRYRFPNGYGASLIKGAASFHLWELAVIKFEPVYKNRMPKTKRLKKKYLKKYNEFGIIYNTPVTSDVNRYAMNFLEALNSDLWEISEFKPNQY